MNRTNEFRMYANEGRWVESNTPKFGGRPCWWLAVRGKAILSALEIKRNNRGITLRVFDLTGTGIELCLKPENGEFAEIDLEAEWEKLDLV